MEITPPQRHRNLANRRSPFTLTGLAQRTPQAGWLLTERQPQPTSPGEGATLSRAPTLKVFPTPSDKVVIIVDQARPPFTHRGHNHHRDFYRSIVDDEANPLSDEPADKSKLIWLVLPLELAVRVSFDLRDRASTGHRDPVVLEFDVHYGFRQLVAYILRGHAAWNAGDQRIHGATTANRSSSDVKPIPPRLPSSPGASLIRPHRGHLRRIPSFDFRQSQWFENWNQICQVPADVTKSRRSWQTLRIDANHIGN